MKQLKQLAKQLRDNQALMAVQFHGQSALVNVQVRADKQLDDLQHIDRQKSAFLDNFDAFLAGKPYHHALLWGARGTGKSTLVRATFLHYANCLPDELAIVQLDSQALEDLAAVIWTMGQVAKRFVLFIDDVSFSLNDGRYKALKAVLDGAIAEVPRNVLLVLTSNRRHLLRESHHDDAIHPEEDGEEQVSLAERFGLRLSFHPMSQEQYLAVVEAGLGQSLENQAELRQSALQFALAHGSRSARVARQFVDSRLAYWAMNTTPQALPEQSALASRGVTRYTEHLDESCSDCAESGSEKILLCKKSCEKDCKKPCKKSRKKHQKCLQDQRRASHCTHSSPKAVKTAS